MIRLCFVLLYVAASCAVKIGFDAGAALFGFIAEGVKRIRQRRRRKRMAKRMASWAEEHGGPPDEVIEDFNSPDEAPTMNMALLLPILGSVARTFLPAASAYLAGLGINVGAENPLVTLAIALAVYAVMQAWSIIRKVRRNAAPTQGQ